MPEEGNVRMRKNRNEVQIIYEFLNEINEGNFQTSSLLRKVNIPYNKYEDILKHLLERGMVTMEENGNKNTLSLTDKGREFIEQYKRFSKMMEKSYGLKL
jgi:predicted transcriptional regulator